MRTLITGAAGLYGASLVPEFLKYSQKETVFGIDNLFRQYLAYPFPIKLVQDPRFHFIKGDFLDLTPNEMALDTVIHLAAHVSVPESMNLPFAERAGGQMSSDDYFTNNDEGTFKLLQILLQTKTKPMLVMASSGKVYGDIQYTPVDIKHPLNPTSIYGVSKLAAEKYAMACWKGYGYPVVVVRNFNTYGPNQNTGFSDAAVIANFVIKALTNKPLVVHGDGSQTRDFTYVGDAARAYEMISFSGKERMAGRIFQMASGRETSIQQIAETVVALSGSKSEIVHTDDRPKDKGNMCADNSLLREAVGWAPVYTLEQGIEKTIEWYRKALM
jgi:UDP-glucose 4-epimerase